MLRIVTILKLNLDLFTGNWLYKKKVFYETSNFFYYFDFLSLSLNPFACIIKRKLLPHSNKFNISFAMRKYNKYFTRHSANRNARRRLNFHFSPFYHHVRKLHTACLINLVYCLLRCFQIKRDLIHLLRGFAFV